jgi:lysophospholipase L1-like esterase
MLQFKGLMRGRRMLTLAVLFACGQTTAMGDRAQVNRQVAAPTIVRAAAEEDDAEDAGPPAPLARGALDNTAALKRFFEALAKLDDGVATEDVRIDQFGDSHTAADMLTGTARRALQARFGDGGRGFVAIGKPWRSYWQNDVRSPGMTQHDWQSLSLLGKIDHGHWVFGDGCYGLGGVCLVTNKRDARLWSEFASPTSKIEVDYWEQPSGGSFDLVVDEKSLGTIKTHGGTPVSAFKEFDVTEGPHKVELRTHGDGDVRVFGVSLDREKVGVVYDALGINGARAAHVSKSNEPHLQEQLRHRAPALVVFAFGTNESADERPLQDVEHEIVGALGRILRAVPTASCLLLGPPDRAVQTPSDNPYTEGKDAGGVWGTAPRLEQIVEMEKKIAGACAFWNQFAAMGGAGSIETWAEETPPKAQRDRVHLSRDGYVMVGNMFAGDILAAYAAWRAQNGLTPRSPTQTPDVKPIETAPPPPVDSTTQAPFVAIPL